MAPKKKPIVHSDPEILSGTPVFYGTRVPVEFLFEYLAAGDTLDEFLASFPTVKRKQALAVLADSSEMTLARARSA